MRRATMSTMWLLSDDGSVEGLSLGADACSEHEWGIDGLRSAFGVKKRFENGLADRQAQHTPPVLTYKEYNLKDGTPAAFLIFGDDTNHGMVGDSIPPYLVQEASFNSYTQDPKQGNLVCAWDDKGAFVHARTTEQVQRLREFHAAIEGRDIAFGGDLLDKERFYRAGGLIFVLPSKVAPEIIDAAFQKDQSALRLRAAAEGIGLDKELKADGKRWYALSPRWKDKEESEVMYWLNPMDQQDYHSGLYTADELRQWGKNEGPVMIDKPLRELNRKHSKALDQIRLQMGRKGYDVPVLSIEWKDDDQKDFVVEAKYYHSQDDGNKKQRLETGNYSLDDLKEMFPKPAPVPRKSAPRKATKPR